MACRVRFCWTLGAVLLATVCSGASHPTAPDGDSNTRPVVTALLDAPPSAATPQATALPKAQTTPQATTAPAAKPRTLRAEQPAATDRPNVVLVMTDDQGYGDLGCHGNSHLVTPHLDWFFRQGIELTRFYVSPVCAPTRSSLLTGRYHYRTGVIHTSRGGAKMHGDEVTVAELFRSAGYRTAVFGKWHLGDNYPMRPQDQGFDVSLVHKSGGIGQTPDKPNSYFNSLLWRNGRRVQAHGYCTDVFFDAALRFIRDCHAKGQPFFVYLATNAPHTPLEVADQYWRPYAARGLKETTARVYGMVQNIDENFGRLLSELEWLGLRDRTIVVFLCDNGPQQARYNAGLRGRKASTYEGGIRVPFAVQWPGHLPGGRKLDQIAAHIDLLPTLLDLCGVARPDSLSLDGVSLRPLLEGKTVAWNRSLFFQCHRGLTPHRYQNCAVVTQRWKLVGCPGTFSQEDFPPDREPVFELYDLQADPGEQHDVSSQHPEVVAELRRAYDRWFRSVEQSRHFEPGRIWIDPRREDPTVLCRYQDATYVSGRPDGWSVRVVRGGVYEVTVRTAGPPDGFLCLQWQGQTQKQRVTPSAPSARFHLAPGEGRLDVWYQELGKPRVVVSDNSTLGDVTLKFVSPSE